MKNDFKNIVAEIKTIILSYIEILEQNKILLDIMRDDLSYKGSPMSFKFLDYSPKDYFCYNLNNNFNYLYKNISNQRANYRELVIEFGSLSKEKYSSLLDKFKKVETLSDSELIAFLNHYFYEIEEILKDVLIPLKVTIEKSTWKKQNERYLFQFMNLDPRIYFDRITELNNLLIKNMDVLKYGICDFLNNKNEKKYNN